MRVLSPIIMALAAIALAAGGARAVPTELVTAANAILCLQPDSLTEASQSEVAQSQRRLRGLRCMRTGAGIPLTVLERTHANVWKVRFRPQGISGGVTLWGQATSFTTPDGAPLIHSTRAER
jgi:hypothetical protein